MAALGLAIREQHAPVSHVSPVFMIFSPGNPPQR
jgi:hypothetical protein